MPEPMTGQEVPMGDEPMPGDEQEVNPDDQDVFDLIVANASDFIHNEKNSQGILKAIQGGNAAQMIGQVAANILEQVASAAANSGRNVTAEMALGAAAEIIGEIIELGQAAGVLKDDPETLQQGAMQAFGQIVSGGGQPPPEAGAEAPPLEGEVMPREQPAGAIGRAGGM